MSNLIIEVHDLRTYGPNCLNTNESGQIKTVSIGNTDRQMISSQCRKERIRSAFEELLDDSTLSRRLPRMVSDNLKKMGIFSDDETERIMNFTPSVLGLTPKKLGGEIITKEVLRTTESCVVRIADAFTAYFADRNNIKKIEDMAAAAEKKNEKEGSDKKSDAFKDVRTEIFKDFDLSKLPLANSVAFFGSFLTLGISGAIDSAVYMNMAYSVNARSYDQDYFAAMERYKKANEDPSVWAAGMMGCSDLEASTMYEYCAVSCNTYAKNIRLNNDITDEQVKNATKATYAAFLKGLISCNPAGKQHSNAAGGPPSFLYMVISRRQAKTADSVFETPVSGQNIELQAVNRLASFINDDTFSIEEPIAEFVICSNHLAVPEFTNPNLEVLPNARELIKKVNEVIDRESF